MVGNVTQIDTLKTPTECQKTVCWILIGPATLPETVHENKEVVPVNAVTTWVLLSLITVGRKDRPGAPLTSTLERHDHEIHFCTA